MGERFQDYSWIQDFEADIYRKTTSKFWIKLIITISLKYFIDFPKPDL